MTKVTEWHGYYDGNLKDLIVPEAFKHPAKMSRKLCERIFDYGCEKGYWQSGDLIIDPFGGIGTTGIIGAYRGYHVVCVELEEEFIKLSRQNIELNKQKIEVLGNPIPEIIQGDSRKLLEILGQANGCVTSPPFLQSSGGQPEPKEGGWQLLGKYAEEGRLNVDQVKGGPQKSYPSWSKDRDTSYGETEGQLGKMPRGDLPPVPARGAITSPPYEDSVSSKSHGIDFSKEKPDYPGRKITQERIEMHNRHHSDRNYGETIGQLGSEKGDTYWSAVALIYQQVFQLLPPGGAFAVVIKDFVRNKKRVPLCDQTAELLKTIGFAIPERIHAMLIKEIAQTEDMFTGKSDPKLIKRKSFFRRLAEKKGSPPIDWEEVIWAIKPNIG